MSATETTERPTEGTRPPRIGSLLREPETERPGTRRPPVNEWEA